MSLLFGSAGTGPISFSVDSEIQFVSAASIPAPLSATNVAKYCVSTPAKRIGIVTSSGGYPESGSDDLATFVAERLISAARGSEGAKNRSRYV